MGVDPGGMAIRAREEAESDELEAMLDEADEVAWRSDPSLRFRET